jgi:hypothetical protein
MHMLFVFMLTCSASSLGVDTKKNRRWLIFSLFCGRVDICVCVCACVCLCACVRVCVYLQYMEYPAEVSVTFFVSVRLFSCVRVRAVYGVPSRSK